MSLSVKFPLVPKLVREENVLSKVEPTTTFDLACRLRINGRSWLLIEIIITKTSLEDGAR